MRIELPLQATAYVEWVTFQVLGLEVGTGVEVRYEAGEPAAVTPYTVVAFYQEDYWMAVEARVPVALPGTVGFNVAVAFGGRF